VKAIVEDNGIDVSRFSANPPAIRMRSCKRKFVGNEVSIPANPTPALIKQDIKGLVASGKLSLSEP